MTTLTWASRCFIVLGALGLVAAGCSDSQDEPAGLRGAPMVLAEGEGACGMLASEELELALNASVETKDGDAAAAAGEAETATARDASAQPVSQDRTQAQRPPLLPGMDMCWASSQEGRIIWGVLAADDAEDPLEEVFQEYREWHGDYLDAARVDGYDAVWDEELRTLIVLADDHAIGVRLTVQNAPTDDDTRTDGDDRANEENAGQEEADGDDGEENGAKDAEDEDPAKVLQELDEDEAAYLRAQAEELARRALTRL